jgi:hypothetical protein
LVKRDGRDVTLCATAPVPVRAGTQERITR